GRIYDRLAEEFGNGSVFKDVEDILPGVDFRRVLEHEVSCTDVMLAVIGAEWVNRENKRRLNDPNDFVRFEIETALKRNIPVIPVLVGRRARLPQARFLPPSLRDLVFRNAVPVRPDPDFHHDMDRLIDGIIALFEMTPETLIDP
ncbi:MAG: toll/interleukin-1 receptor domain-containing protein, partial [Anaerolineae bacterium]|nr:toll/interleukin-1 receptor domain-containing protein [Anaerolineae bacterium]